MTDKSSQKDSFLLPTITDLQSAQRLARQGTAVCVLIIIFSSVVAAIATSIDGTFPSQWFIAAMLIYGLIGFLIYRMSRFAAIAGLVMYLSDRLVLLAQQGLSMNVIFTIFFVFAFINSIRGTFAYHRFRRQRTEVLQPSVTSNLN
jgi:hypothetical protein